MEFWDIYDIHRNKTGRTMKRNDWTMKPGDYHLTVLGAVVKPDGRFLITRRAMTKSWAPGCWEIPGGGVQAGETSPEAVAREIREETGLTVPAYGAKPCFSYRRDNPDEGDNYFVDVYRFELDFDERDLVLQEAETDGYMLAAPEEIDAIGKDGKFLHYASIRKVFELD